MITKQTERHERGKEPVGRRLCVKAAGGRKEKVGVRVFMHEIAREQVESI